MTESERLSSEADRLLNEPLLAAALDDMEADALDALLQADAGEHGDYQRAMWAMSIKTIREFKARLRGFILASQYAASKERAPYA